MSGNSDDVTVVDRRATTELRAWRPFAFGELPKMTHAEARAIVTLESLREAGGDAAVDAVRTRLATAFELPMKLAVERVYVAGPNELRRHAHSFLASISYRPQTPPAIVEVEVALAQALVDALLGATADPVPFRPLTDIEEGVIAFAVLEALRGLAAAVDPARWRLRLEGILRTPDEMFLPLEGERRAVVIQLGCEVAAHAGAIRIVLGNFEHDDLVNGPTVEEIDGSECTAHVVCGAKTTRLHHVAIIDEQTRNQAMLLDYAHLPVARKVSSSFMPPSWDFSGWNCTAAILSRSSAAQNRTP